MALSVDDRLAILELAARYSHALDAGDEAAFLNTFTEDGVFEFVHHFTVRPAELLALRARQGRTVRHWTTNPIVDGDGDAATLQLDLMVINREGAARHIVLTGIYRDQLRRVDGAWKFAHRQLTEDST